MKIFLLWGWVINQNLKTLVKFHSKHKKIATLTAVRPTARFEELKILKNKVKNFKKNLN